MIVDADVIVVGAGLAGLVAAHELTSRGRRVALVDQENAANLGGQAFWSFGGLFLVDSPEQRRLGIKDSFDLAWNDWQGSAKFDRVDDEDSWAVRWARAYVEFAAGEKRSWLQGHGISFLEITPEQWQDHLDVNLTGCFNLGQSAARLMVARGHPGRIIFTGSWVQEVPWPEISAYSTTKAGVRMLARSMARELAPHKILVNVIAPGIVNAGLARHQLETEPQYARRVRHVIPLGELQSTAQVARATAFLCSDGADYMTGSVLLVDGGCSLFQFAEDDGE